MLIQILYYVIFHLFSERFEPPVRLIDKPLRLCVQDIFKGQSATFSISGRIEAGDIQMNDRVLVMPAAEPATVKGKTTPN